MSWQQARDQTLDKWYALRDLVGLCEPQVFIGLVRDTQALCREARKEAEQKVAHDDICYYCKWSEQYGRCQPLLDAMSAAAERRDWDSVHALTLNMIGTLENMRFEASAEITESESGEN